MTGLDDDGNEVDTESQTIFDGTGNDLEDNAFISRFEGSRESMRRELSTYLETLKEASSSDGTKLISIPMNFDDVSNAMNRGERSRQSI